MTVINKTTVVISDKKWVTFGIRGFGKLCLLDEHTKTFYKDVTFKHPFTSLKNEGRCQWLLTLRH